MKNWTVCYAVAEVYTVEASSEADAREKAAQKLFNVDIDLCHQCTDKVEPCDPYEVTVSEE